MDESHQKNGSLTSSSNVSKPQSLNFNSRLNYRRNQNSKSNIQWNQILKCKNSGLKGHLIEKCYNLTGYPKHFKPRIEYNNNNN